MNLGMHIKILRKAKGWSQLQLSKKTSISRARIAQIETNPTTKVKSETMFSLANAFNMSVDQLSSNALFKEGGVDGLEIRPVTKKVPVIKWNQINHSKEQRMESDKWIGTPLEIADSAFALEVEGNAMTSSAGISFPNGSIIYINPAAEHKNGDKVVTAHKKSGVGVFRTYINEAGQKMLLAQNPQYPTLNMSDYVVIGVVVGCFQAI